MRVVSLAPWLVTCLLHAVLALLALAWVLHSARVPPTPAPEIFVVAGGGSPSVRPEIHRNRPQARVPPVTRLVSQSADSQVVLPDSPLPAFPRIGALGREGTGGGGSTASGFRGAGQGMGIASGRVGLPVLGLRVQARRLAVYLDSSGSMRPHLARIEAEIRTSFPDADVFRFDGARVVIRDGQIEEGRGYDGPSPARRPGFTDPASLTPEGRRLLDRLAPRCEAGSLGAWIDWMLEERYDALVVFSDFQDGIRQYREEGKGPAELIYADTKRRQEDDRGPGDDRWRRRWLERFALAPSGRAPRLYLLTSEVEPQSFLKECAVASGGGLTMVEVGRSRPSR